MAYHSSMKKTDFDRLVASVKQAGQIRRGRLKPSRVTTFKPADVTGIRQRLGKTQSQFALMIGVSLATLRNWEQGRRHPDGPARALLTVAAVNPRAVELALTAEYLERRARRGTRARFVTALSKVPKGLATARDT